MARTRLLIVTGFETLEGFQLPMENRTLLWGLDQANIDWWLYNPWRPRPDLSRFDAALVTLYWGHNRNFAYYCKKFEEHCAAAGFPVVNSAQNAQGYHSYYLSAWQAAGIRCARFQRFRSFADLTLDTYPLILRRDGVHRGSGMFLVRTPEEAREAIERQHTEAAAGYPSLRHPLPLDLAIEFVETRRMDGYYCKWRSYVVGDEVIPAHFMRSRSPFVNYKDAALWAGTCATDEVFRFDGEPHPERVLAAARATGFEVVAIDYAVTDDGEYVFWEGNRLRATAGDFHVRWLGMREVDLEYGAAMARLVQHRAARTEPSPAPPPRAPRVPDAAEFMVPQAPPPPPPPRRRSSGWRSSGSTPRRA